MMWVEAMGWVLIGVGAVPVIYLAILATVAFPRRRLPVPSRTSRIAVLIPAHNEEATLGGLLEDLRAQTSPPAVVLVVAHRCTDGTEGVAAAGGAEVLPLLTGSEKSDALAAGFAHLAARDWDAILVIDADCRLDPEALARSKIRPDGAVQARIELDPGGDRRGLLYSFFYRVEDASLHVGRERLGLFAFLHGTGMFLGREALARAPWASRGLTEDRSQTYAFLACGIRVRLDEAVTVHTPPPRATRESWDQRRRWLSVGLPAQIWQAVQAALRARSAVGYRSLELPLAAWADARSQWLGALFLGTALVAAAGGDATWGIRLLGGVMAVLLVAGVLWYRTDFLISLAQAPRVALITLGAAALGLLGRRPGKWKRGRS